MGLYGSHVDRIGMLAADSMRATRLVVDRERGRMAFRSASYWDLEAVVDGDEAGDPTDGRVEGGVDLALAGWAGCLRVEHLRRG